MDNINDIIPPEYKSRRFLNGDTRKNYRNIDPHPEHVLGTYTPHVPQHKEPKIITYDDFLKLFRKTYMNYAIFQNWPVRTCQGKTTRIYIHEDNNQKIYDIIQSIVDQQPKGVYLVGDHGSGKSEFMRVLTETINMTARFDNIHRIYTHSYDRIYDAIRATGDIGHIQNLKNSIYLDDLCYQSRSMAKIWGNNDSVADLIITRAYELYKAGHRIMMTSNYGPEFMMKEGYIHKGSADRIYEMMSVVVWSGASLRR